MLNMHALAQARPTMLYILLVRYYSSFQLAHIPRGNHVQSGWGWGGRVGGGGAGVGGGGAGVGGWLGWEGDREGW